MAQHDPSPSWLPGPDPLPTSRAKCHVLLDFGRGGGRGAAINDYELGDVLGVGTAFIEAWLFSDNWGLAPND